RRLAARGVDGAQAAARRVPPAPGHHPRGRPHRPPALRRPPLTVNPLLPPPQVSTHFCPHNGFQPTSAPGCDQGGGLKPLQGAEVKPLRVQKWVGTTSAARVG